MTRRTPRAGLVHQLISPVRTRLQHRMPRIRRSFPNIQPRWAVGRALAFRPIQSADRTTHQTRRPPQG
ncbi:MAG: hypothetical protein ACRDGQ_14915 [Candidatus Limnocylindrales bacterium]